ncbi:MAG: GNAT family protein [Pseudomonadota bacterium]
MTDDLMNWTNRRSPRLEDGAGRWVRIAPADFARDGGDLFAALGGPGNDDLWRYIPVGPFESAGALSTLMAAACDRHDWRMHVIRDAASGTALGMAGYMRIRPEHGSAEVGCIVLSKALQRTRAATEAMYLMARHIFDDLGYRRYEWKCNDANAASKRAALRLGFTPEGVFRQDMVVKGDNRDTAWFSMLDREWPRVKSAFEAWLDPENFDPDGRQRRSLASCRQTA